MNLTDIYRAYIECLNKRELARLSDYINEKVIYNGKEIGLNGYVDMISRNYHDIPDLRFDIQFIVAEFSFIGSRLRFNCHPKADFMGIQIYGKRVIFYKNVFYQFKAGKIIQVWSEIDKTKLSNPALSDNG